MRVQERLTQKYVEMLNCDYDTMLKVVKDAQFSLTDGKLLYSYLIREKLRQDMWWYGHERLFNAYDKLIENGETINVPEMIGALPVKAPIINLDISKETKDILAKHKIHTLLGLIRFFNIGGSCSVLGIDNAEDMEAFRNYYLSVNGSRVTAKDDFYTYQSTPKNLKLLIKDSMLLESTLGSIESTKSLLETRNKGQLIKDRTVYTLFKDINFTELSRHLELIRGELDMKSNKKVVMCAETTEEFRELELQAWKLKMPLEVMLSVYLIRVKGMKIDEVASFLDYSVSTIRKRLEIFDNKIKSLKVGEGYATKL